MNIFSFSHRRNPGRGWHLLPLLLWGLVLPTLAPAQVNRYTFSQSTTPYVPLGAGSTLIAIATTSPPGITGQAFLLAPGTIPFPFTFNGTPYTGCYVAQAGFLTFGATPPIIFDFLNTATTGYYFFPISTPTAYDGAVSPFASHLLGRTFQGNWAELRSQTLGTTPNRVFVVQWKDMPDDNSGGYYNFQARLHETTNAIDFAYGACLAQFNGQVQTGLRGYTTSDFNNRKGLWNATVPGLAKADSVLLRVGNVPANGLVYTYTPGLPLPCAQPFSLVADQVASTTARLTWRVAASSGGNGPFTVRYGPAGFNPATPGAGTTATAPAGATSLAVGGLTLLTDYDFYVTQNCGGAAGDSPISSPKGTFRTTLANDDPPEAIDLPIGATCTPVAGTTVGATTTPVNGYAPQPGGSNCNNNPSIHDVWYKFTAAASGPASQTVTLTTTGTGAQQINLFRTANGAAGPFTTLACAGFGSGRPPVLTYGPLTPGTTYYLNVAGNTRDAPFTICATYPPGCGDPLNLNVGSVTATTAQLTFVPSSGNPVGYVVTLTPAGGSPTTVAPAPAAAPINLSALLPGTAYTVTLQANCGAAGLSTALTRTFTTPPLNDEATGAVALPLNATCVSTTGNLTGATVSAAGPNPALCSGRLARPDVWYRFTTTASGPGSGAVRLELGGPDGYDLFVYSSANGAAGPFTLVNCLSTAGGAGGGSLDLPALQPATTYFAKLYGTNSFSFPAFSICARFPATCPDPATLTAGSLTPTSAVLNWFVAGTGPPPPGYVVTYTPQNGTALVLTPATAPVTLTNLLPGTLYTVVVQSDCGPLNGLSNPVRITFRTPGPPVNDLCSGATALACSQTLGGSTTGATRTGDPTALCNARSPGAEGVWYVYQGGGRAVTLTTCQPSSGLAVFATQLFVYAGSCTGLTCVTSSQLDPTCPRTYLAAATFTAQAGQPYYVLVTNPYGGTGDFALTATCGPLAAADPSLAAQVSVFPNPASQAATVAVPAGLLAQPATLALFNALGQAVRTLAVPAAPAATRLPLDLRGLPTGVYTLRLATGQGPVTKRLVVE